MIFNGSYFVGLKASRTYTELSRKEVISSKTDLIVAIKKAYYSVLVSRERLGLVEKNYQRLDSLLAQTKAMYNNGFAEKIDVSRIQVQFNNIITAKNTNAIGMEVSMNILKWQMGLPMDSKIELSDNLESIHLQVLEDDFGKNFDYNNRIEYSKLEVNRELVKLDIKNTNAQYLPKLDFYGNYGASYGTSAFGSFLAFGANWRDFAVYGIRANLPIFDGLRKSNQVQQKKIQLQQLENTKEFTKNQIDMEQRQTSLTFSNNLTTLKSQKENMQLAEEVYNVSVIKYQQGVGSNIEVINADASYKEAQVNYYAALYDALITSVDLEKAYGKILSK
jgi:outer membrane protein